MVDDNLLETDRKRYADDVTVQDLVRLRVENEQLREALRTIAMSHLEKDDRNSGWGYCISIARSALQQKESE